MKHGIKKRILSLVLCISMVLPMAAVPMPVYSVESEESIAPITNPFTPETIITLPDGTTTSSQSYRIPSMVTLADGTIVAAADIRWNTTYDGGGLDTLVARSTDGGKTWSYNTANYLGDNRNEYNYSSTTFIDPNLLVAADGQTVYMLVDLYAYGVALNGLWQTNTKPYFSYPEADTGFDANGNLKLSNDDRSTFGYYLKDGKIYADGATDPVEGYTVDAYFNITYIANGETLKSNLFFGDSPFKVARTQFLYLTKSTNGGVTWSEPTLLNLRENPSGASNDEDALLVAPGNAITTTKGLMVYPTYRYAHTPTSNSASASEQKLCLIYSTDGVNWKRTPNYGGLEFSSEGSIVELQNGKLRVFFRNKTSHLCYVDYDLDAGVWDKHVEMAEVPVNSDTQMSAISYSTTSNGKQVVLVSCPTGPNGAGYNDGNGAYRTNGKIHIFTVNTDSTMKLENTINLFDNAATGALSGSNYLAEDGFFAYSALTERADGSIVVLYENNQFGWGAGDNCFYTMDIKGYLPSALGIPLDEPQNIIVDGNGNVIDSIIMGQYEKPELTANAPFSTTDVDYQWQIEYESGKWVDIYGEDSKTVNISYGMVATLLGDDGKVDIRCKSTTGSQVVYSKPITVTIEMYQPEEPDVVVSDSFTTSSGETVTVTVAGALPEDASVQLGETDSAGVDVKPSETVVAALDISIKNADGTEWQPESGETVTVTLEASKIGLKNGDEFVVYHLHDGEVRVLGSYKVANDTISFEVDGFSKFVFTLAEQTLFADDLESNVGRTATLRYDYFAAVKTPTEENQVMAVEGVDYPAGIEFVIIGVYVTDSYPYNIYYNVELKDKTLSNEFLNTYPWIYQGQQDEDPSWSTLILHDIPEEPEEPSVGITVNGEKVTEITVSTAQKVTLTATPNVEGTATYKWQLLIPQANMWVDISGQTSADCIVNYGMVANRFDADGKAHIRCVTTVDSKSIISDIIEVSVLTATAFKRFARTATVSYNAVAEENASGSGTTIYNVMIQYVFADGRQAANPWMATIEAGGDFSRIIASPEVVGYKPDKAEIALDIQDISGNITHTVTYQPAEVSYIVVHKFQNVNDEAYSVYKRTAHKGYTDSFVGEGLAMSKDQCDALGVYALPYDIEQKIAADGTTEVVIMYDRFYYLMTFDLSGGYGVEPIYSRVGTQITVGTPIRAGYAFDGWEPAVPEEMPAQDMNITAKWIPGNTTYIVAYWAENANDNGYSFWSYKKLGAVSGTIVSGSDDFTGTTELPKTGFHFDHADTNVTVKGDGSTVVNVYYKRNTYTLTFAYENGPLLCNVHVHSYEECCKQTCTREEHKHEYEDSYRTGGIFGTTYYVGGCYPEGNVNEKTGGATSPTCGKTEHAHGASCYDRTEYICGKTGVSNHTHSVRNGCYGVKYEGIKYGQDTSYWWTQAPVMKWLVSYNGDTFYTAAPAMPDSDLTIYGTTQSGSSTIHYYEIVNGNKTTNSVRSDYTVNTDGWRFTSEDYISIPGFTYNSSNKNSQGTEYFIYYTRNSYNLTFKNGSETKDAGTHLYQSDISGQYYVPTYNGDDPEGYTFGGWYTTEACVPGTEWISTGATMPYNNLILYAKWVPVSHYVKLYITKEDWTNGKQYLDTMVVSHNAVAQEPARPANGSYNFVGWFYMEDGVEKAFDFDIPVRKELNLYGKWVADELADYTIKYAVKNPDGSLTYIADATTGKALAGTDKTFDAKSGNDLYADYRTGYYPETNSHSMNVLLDQNNTYTFIYVPKDEVAYTVKYLEKGTENILAPQKNYVTREAVHTENFVYVRGYRPDAYQKRIVLSADKTENVIIFWYEADDDHAPVLVKHYLQNAAGTGYNTTNPYLTTTDLDGVIGSPYEVDVITTLTGFKFAKAEANYGDVTVSGTKVSAEVTAQGLLIELYYDRIQYPYEFRFIEQGTNTVLHQPVKGNASYGSQVTHAAIVIPGYTCNVANHAITIQAEDGTTAVKNVRTFYYVEKTVNITYIPVGPSGASDFGTVKPSAENGIPVLSGTVGGSSAMPANGYRFIGWFKDLACSQPVDPAWVSGNTLIPKKNSEGMFESATYYAKFEYNLTSLTINKKTTDEDGNVMDYSAIDPNQTFIFNIKGNGVDLDVTVHRGADGNWSTTIDGLTVGAKYTITEKTNWSWRYGCESVAITNANPVNTVNDGATIELGLNGTITFTNTRAKYQWLDGDSWCNNIFK